MTSTITASILTATSTISGGLTTPTLASSVSGIVYQTSTLTLGILTATKLQNGALTTPTLTASVPGATYSTTTITEGLLTATQTLGGGLVTPTLPVSVSGVQYDTTTVTVALVTATTTVGGGLSTPTISASLTGVEYQTTTLTLNILTATQTLNGGLSIPTPPGGSALGQIYSTTTITQGLLTATTTIGGDESVPTLTNSVIGAVYSTSTVTLGILTATSTIGGDISQPTLTASIPGATYSTTTITLGILTATTVIDGLLTTPTPQNSVPGAIYSTTTVTEAIRTVTSALGQPFTAPTFVSTAGVIYSTSTLELDFVTVTSTLDQPFTSPTMPLPTASGTVYAYATLVVVPIITTSGLPLATPAYSSVSGDTYSTTILTQTGTTTLVVTSTLGLPLGTSLPTGTADPLVYTSTSTTVVNPAPTVQTPAATFACDSSSYFVQTLNNVVSLSNIDLASGQTTLIDTALGASEYTSLNALGFNPLDNYLYAIGTSLTAGTYAVVRISNDGTLTSILSFQSPTNPSYVGDIDANGQYWFSSGGTGSGIVWYQVNLNPNTASYQQIVSQGTTALNGYSCFDWSYLPNQGNYLYTLGQSTDASPTFALLQFSMETNTWSVVDTFPSVPAPNRILATWGSNDGKIWGLEAVSGTIRMLDILSSSPALVTESTGPTGITNGDGARCGNTP